MTKVPAYRFSGYTDVWEQRKLGEVLTERNVQQVPTIDYPLVSFTVESGVTPKTDRYNREFLVREDEKKYKVTKKDDIVYNPANLKFGAISLNSYGNAVFSPIYVTYEVNQHLAFPDFIAGIVTSKNFIQRALKYQEGTVYERMAVKSDDFLRLEVRVPELAEQTAIGNFFQTLDRSIALHQRKLDSLKEQKKTYLQKLFPRNGETIPEIRFPEFQNAPAWEQRKLGEVVDILGGNAWKSNTYSEKGKYLIITISNVKGDEYVDDSYGNRIDTTDTKFVLSKDDILISMTGNVGRVSKMTAEDAVLNQRVAKIVTTSNSEFIYTVLSDSKFENQMILSSQGAAQANISNKDVLNYQLLLPTPEEQTAIGNFFQTLDRSIAQHQTKLDKLKESKQTLLKKMFV